MNAMNNQIKLLAFFVVLAGVIGSIIYLEGFPGGALDVTSSPYEFVAIEGWLNSDPLTMESLRGKVVLVDFWTYSCINCIRTFPYLNSWYDKYSDKDFIIIGVHSPEFAFEKEINNVRDAIELYGLKFPVAIDNDHGTFRGFANRYWPHKYLFDAEGNLRYDHIGEGAYMETERNIQALLLENGVDVSHIPLEDDDRFINPALGEAVGDQTRELYAVRDVVNRAVDGTNFVDGGESHSREGIYLNGLWEQKVDHYRSLGSPDGVNFFQISYRGRSASPVMGASESNEDSFLAFVFLDNEVVPRYFAGPDLLFDGEGRSYVLITGPPRLYSLVNADIPIGSHELRVSTGSVGLAIWSVTFGS